MEISGISAAVPQRIIDNNEIIDLIKYYSKNTPSRILKNVIEEVEHVFKAAGSKTRHWRLPHEKPLDLIEESFNKSISQAGISPCDVDMLIYASIHRGMIEPATSSIVCRRLQIKPKYAFDVLDACMGWGSALDICKRYLSDKACCSACIITSEFPNNENGPIIPSCFTIENGVELKNKVASYTMGEGATSTILTNYSTKDWKVVREEYPEFAPYCSVPGECHELFSDEGDNYAINGVGIFVAHMRELAIQGYKKGLKIMKRYINEYTEPEFIIPHSISESLPAKVKAKLRLSSEIFSTFSRFGNIATSSIPTSLVSAIQSRKITSKSDIVGWVGSAGMKFSVFSLPLSTTAFK